MENRHYEAWENMRKAMRLLIPKKGRLGGERSHL